MAKHDYRELAKQAGVSIATIYRWLGEGILDSELAKAGVRAQPDMTVGEPAPVTPDPKPDASQGEILEEPMVVDGKTLYVKRYVRMVTPNGKPYWEALPQSEEEVKWRGRQWTKTKKEILEKDPSAFDAVVDTKTIPTGIAEIDSILGGGLAEGRMVEIYGEFSTGKTTFALQTAANFQRLGNKVVYFDSEQTIDKAYAIALGVDFDKLEIDQDTNMENTIEKVRGICRTGAASLVIVDSIAALVPMGEREGQAGDANIASKAKLMSFWCRVIGGNMSEKKVTVLFLNQIRNFSQGGWGSSEYTPGGNSLKFHASQRICLRGMRTKDKTESRNIKVICEKNKISEPYGVAEMTLEYGKGFRPAT
jgi:protein RecA